MPDFNVRSDSVNVEQIMEQIRTRIREKRGVDYTEQQIRELAAVKLEKFLDPRSVRSDLLSQFQQGQPDPNYAFEEDTLFETHRAPLRWIRRMLRPILLLLFNANKLTYVLHMQSGLNANNTRQHALFYELIHNLVLEVTRLGIETKNLKMRTETLTGRLEFSERRARALEAAVMYRPAADEEDAPPPGRTVHAGPPVSAPTNVTSVPSVPATVGPAPTPSSGAAAEGPGQRSRRRRRRRGRRGGTPATAIMGGPAPGTNGGASDAGAAPATSSPAPNEGAPGPAESDDEQ